MELKAYAKINISIDVLGKRDDGYHDVRMIMQSIDLCDVINFSPRDEGIKIYCDVATVPFGRSNTVHKVLELVKERYDIPYGMDVDIEKRIPVSAGLAGGSTDGAAALIAANSVWGLNMSYDEMISLGKEAGADIPFCLTGGTSLAEGIGERITPLPPLKDVEIVIAKPPVSVSTAEVYKNLKMDEIVSRPDTEGLIKALSENDIYYIARNMINVLETVTIKEYPIVDEIKRIMVEFGALGSLMSGSGPTVFGLFDDGEYAEKCYNRLKDYITDVYRVRPVGFVREI